MTIERALVRPLMTALGRHQRGEICSGSFKPKDTDVAAT